MKSLRDALAEESFVLDLDAHRIEDIFSDTLDYLVARNLLPADERDAVEASLLKREASASTAIGHAVAVPHAYLDAVAQPRIVFVRLNHPVNLGAPDGIPTHFVFMLLGPTGSEARHLDTLTTVARLMADDEFRFDAGEARNSGELLAALDRFDARASVPIREERREIPEDLVATGMPLGGILQDVRRKLPTYASDFRDGLNPKCMASTLFLYFACLAPAVTFGGLMAVATGGQIGAVEMLLASAVCGVVYALTAGQPLIILGGTGPLLVFTGILYELCVARELPFLETYAWVGLWTAFFLVLLAVTDASSWIRFFTRFTDEIFAALISIIFIVEAVTHLIEYFEDESLNELGHDTALLSLLLALGTFYIATNLGRFRRSRYLRPRVREFLADFGPAIAVSCMTLVAVWLHEVSLERLSVPEAFGTTTGRPWQVDLFSAPRWIWFAAAGPAALAAILMYLDQNITARLVNNNDHNLKKGAGYHLDLAIVGVLTGVCSVFGLPWLVAATVRSLNHLRSLATLGEVQTQHGETHERIIRVRENRVTGLAIHLLIGLSLVLLTYLRDIPMAVLYGLFLYMGVVTLSGNQFFERLSLWVMDWDLYPSTHYIRKVPIRIVHSFTLMQTICLGILWFVKVSTLAILFPLFIALLVPVRLVAGRFFEPEHLEALDAEEEPEDEETHWAG